MVGQTFGGENPPLRINKFQTESERNEQKGLEQILRGIYKGIRNPRSHDQIEDGQTAANAIILFVDYLANIISESKEPFSFLRFPNLHLMLDHFQLDLFRKVEHLSFFSNLKD